MFWRDNLPRSRSRVIFTPHDLSSTGQARVTLLDCIQKVSYCMTGASRICQRKMGEPRLMKPASQFSLKQLKTTTEGVNNGHADCIHGVFPDVRLHWPANSGLRARPQPRPSSLPVSSPLVMKLGSSCGFRSETFSSSLQRNIVPGVRQKGPSNIVNMLHALYHSG